MTTYCPFLDFAYRRLSRGVFQGVQGATVLHCLARLCEMTIQGATQGATKCYTGCYIFPRSMFDVSRTSHALRPTDYCPVRPSPTKSKQIQSGPALHTPHSTLVR
jgi:hypothetical protein